MFAIAFLFVRVLCDCFKSRRRLEAEVLVLRHQLNVLQQRAPRRLYLTWADRALFVWLYRGFPRILDAIMILRPETITVRSASPTYIVRDNDRAFGSVFTRRIQAMGIRDRPTSFRSPWQNGHVERLIGSIRRECTDHLIVLNEEHLRRILTKFATYYNGWRPHVSLGKDAPDRRPIERFGDIVAHAILGGLHHRYARI